MKSYIIILLGAVVFQVNAQHNPKFLNVMAVNGLNIRSAPQADSRIVTKATFGKRVEVLEKTKVELQLGWIKDHWYKVRYRGREGYIFGGYLSELKSPEQVTEERLADILPVYSAQSFQMDGEIVEDTEATNSGDKLKITIARFTNGAELELESDALHTKAILVLNASVQESYVLLEALLKQSHCGNKLDDLRFVQDPNGQLMRVSNSDGTIAIKRYSDQRTAVTLTTFM